MKTKELKEKIVDILVNCKSDRCAIEYCAECDGNPSIENCREKQQADALIAAGIGDVKEAEHRAEVAERALYLLSKSVHEFYMKTKFVGDYFVNDPKMICTKFLKQAEKELAEERKDEKLE